VKRQLSGRAGSHDPGSVTTTGPLRALSATSNTTTTGTGLAEEIIELGGKGIMNCYQCGTCTAVCPLSETSSANFRKTIKYVQLGLQKKLLGDITPWLCYYCGDCQASCPRNANPSEIMAAVRRYQTGKYDWTGFSARLIKSRWVELASIFLLAAFTGLIVWLFHGPIVTSSVQLESFAPIGIVEPVGIAVFAILAALLMSNTFRMFRFVSRSSPNPVTSDPPRGPVAALKQAVTVLGAYFVTQFPMSECGARRRWFDHVLMVAGYAVSFILFVVLLRFTLINQIYPWTNPLVIAGFFSAFALLYGTTISIARRARRSDTYSKSARHSTDWMFVLLLFSTALSGLLVVAFQYLSMPLATYAAFTVHLSCVVPLLVLEVPFAKWSHLAYRPFAAYFAALRGMKIPRLMERGATHA
jgi:nitrate reductase gamma subunit/NAD-dependent dihydropyrimidine dehydrogenase PreA subunit